MIRKPWPIIFLTIFFVIAPFVNVFTTYWSVMDKISLGDYFYSLFYYKENYIKVFNMVVPGFAAAFAVFSVKKWSYYVLILCCLWLGVNSYLSLSGDHSTWTVILSVAFPMMFNIFLGSYFLIPSVKTTYYDPSVRWWEHKPRYKVSSSTRIRVGSNEFLGNILNISEGGVFLSSEQELVVGDDLVICFELEGKAFSLEAKSIFEIKSSLSYGLEFINLNAESTGQLKKLTRGYKKAKVEVSRPIPLWNEDLKEWFSGLFKKESLK